VLARSTHSRSFSDFKSDPNRYKGTISTLVGLLTGLIALFLHGGSQNIKSNITGTLPTELGRLSLLQQFICNDQRVTGTIPTELAQWTSVRYLDISGNTGVTGSFEHLFQLTKLTTLALAGQLFSGTLSSRLTALTGIRTLSLSGMGLSGTMPPLTALTKLTSLRINSNAFHGQFPELNSTSITTLEIRRNRFSGALRLPENVFMRTFVDFVCQLQNATSETNCLNCDDAPSFCVCQARNCTPFMPPVSMTTTATTATTAATTTATTAATTATATTKTTTATAAPVTTSTTTPTTSQSAAFSDAANESSDVTGIAIGASIGALVAVLGIAGVAFWVCRKRTDKPENGPATSGESSSEYGRLPPPKEYNDVADVQAPSSDYGSALTNLN
jgi:hypothetical protein